MSKAVKVLALALITAGSVSVAFAQLLPQQPYYPEGPELPAYPAAPEDYYYSDIGPNFPVAPYWFPNPSYRSYRGRLRSDFNRGVGFPRR
jgi:hypothetical protein